MLLHSVASLLARNKYLDVALVNEDAVAGLAGGLAQDALLDQSLDRTGRGGEVGAHGSGDALDIEHGALPETV